MAKKNSIHIKESKKGTLHKALGIPEGEKIPLSKLKIKESDSPALKKKKQFALNARKFKHQMGGQPVTLPANGAAQYNWDSFSDPNQIPIDPITGEPLYAVDPNQMGIPSADSNMVPLHTDVQGDLAYWGRSTRTGPRQTNPFTPIINGAMVGVTGIANIINNQRLKNQERRMVLDSQIPEYMDNFESEGLNNIPMYTMYGGAITKKEMTRGIGPHPAFYGKISAYKAGGDVSVEKAKEILRDGTANGKKLTEKQKRYFGWIAGGKKQTGGATAPVTSPAAPQGYVPSTLQQRQDWNKYLDYLQSQGLAGNTVLDQRDQGRWKTSFQEFAKANPNLSINEGFVPTAQYEGTLLRQGQPVPGVADSVTVDRFQKVLGDPWKKTISPVDSWVGSITSKMYYPGISASTSSPAFGQDYAGYSNYVTNAPARQAGGMGVTYGLPDGMHQLANVEAEEGEVFQNAQGGFEKIADDAGTHEEGGVMVPNVERVLEDTSDKRKDKASKALRMSPTEIKEIFGFKPKTGLSHSKAFEKANEHFDKQRAQVDRANKNINDKPQFGQYENNSLKLNMLTTASIPTPQDVFDVLFEHQEAIKADAGISDDGKMKYGGFKVCKVGGKMVCKSGGKMQAGGLNRSRQNVNPNLTTPAGNVNAVTFPGGLEGFRNAWAPLLDLSGFQSPQEVQGATYDYLLNNNYLDAATALWSEGLTNRGQELFTAPGASPEYRDVVNTLFDKDFKLKAGAKPTVTQLQQLRDAYTDGYLYNRLISPSVAQESVPATPPGDSTSFPVPTSGPGLPAPNAPLMGVRPSNPSNEFYEPTYWDDLAAPLMSLADSMTRDPELFNPVQFHQLRYKLLDPTAAMNANQSDFNAANQALGNNQLGSGSQAANMANLLAQKYQANQQVQSNYDNQNVGIKNQEITYNTGVRDKQSLADAQTREKFYTNVLTARDNQRLQKLKSIEDLSRVASLKRRQNTSGNLILQLTPAFDQYGKHNGYQYVYTNPTTGAMMPVGNPVTGKLVPKSKTTNTVNFTDGRGKVVQQVRTSS